MLKGWISPPSFPPFQGQYTSLGSFLLLPTELFFRNSQPEQTGSRSCPTGCRTEPHSQLSRFQITGVSKNSGCPHIPLPGNRVPGIAPWAPRPLSLSKASPHRAGCQEALGADVASLSPWQANIFEQTGSPERTCKQPTSPSTQQRAGGEQSGPRVGVEWVVCRVAVLLATWAPRCFPAGLRGTEARPFGARNSSR